LDSIALTVLLVFIGMKVHAANAPLVILPQQALEVLLYASVDSIFNFFNYYL